jgi:hypothetical protein
MLPFAADLALAALAGLPCGLWLRRAGGIKAPRPTGLLVALPLRCWPPCWGWPAAPMPSGCAISASSRACAPTS